MPEQPPLSERSEEVQEILSHVPRWMIRWGITAIVAIIVAFIGITFIFKYPEVIVGEAEISSTQSSVSLVPNASGRLVSLIVSEMDEVDSGQALAVLHSPLSPKEVSLLNFSLSRLPTQQTQEENKAIAFPDSLRLGEYQPIYNELLQAIAQYNQLIADPLTSEKLRFLKKKIASLYDLSQVIARQKSLAEKELKQARKKHELNKELYDMNGSTQFEYFNSESELNRAENGLEAVKKELINHQLQINELQNQQRILELDQHHQLEVTWLRISNAKRSLQSGLEDWVNTFTITSPTSGRVNFVAPMSEGMFIRGNDPMFVIIPQTGSVVAYAKVHPQNSGKIQPGMSARIKLLGFPHTEFGFLEATVEDISPSLSIDGDELSYRVSLNLPHGLVTQLGQEIPYKPQMPGSVEIITNDVSLADRFLQSLTSKISQ